MSQSLYHPTRSVVRLLATLVLSWAPAVLSLSPGQLAAQDPAQAGVGRVSGAVTNETGQPLEGAQVTVVNTTIGSLTGPDGRYTLANVPAGAVQVRAQRIGYAPVTQTVMVAPGQTATLNFGLNAQAITLNTIVSVGYTNQERRDISGAVASVTDEAFDERKVATIQEALRGRIPGVQIVSSGEPGEASRVVIRGQNFLQSSEPLYVVDGLYLRQNPNLNPDDIASIQVLKDASAAAQYGAQAANGVVVVTTKRGSSGDTKVALRSYAGRQSIPKRLDLADARRWAEINAQAYQNAGLAVLPATQAILNGTVTVDTDWQDAVFRTGMIQDHNLQASGGTGSASYLVSGGYFNQEGTILGSSFERYSFRVNSDMRRGRLTLGENIALSRSNRRIPVGNQLIDALRFPPTIPIRDPNSVSGFGIGTDAIPTFGTNPVGSAELRNQRDRVNQVFGTLYGELGLLQNLRYRLNLGVNYQDFGYRQFTRSGYPVRQNETIRPEDLLDQRDNRSLLQLENLLTFDQAFGRSEVNAVVGYSEQREDYTRISGSRQGFPDPTLTQLDAGTINQANRGFLNDARLQSILGRVNYVFADRYLFTGSIRRDGSSRFGPDNRYGTFGSGSVGWVLSEEDFFKNSMLGRSLAFFKLRASYGTLGNQDFDDYQFAAAIVSGGFGLGGTGYPFGPGQAVQPGAIQRSLANPDIKWQENTQANFGFDASMMDERLTLTGDYYISESDGILVRAPLPPSLGSREAPYVNAGAVRNSGFELGATYAAFERENFELNVAANITTTSNEVRSLGNNAQPVFMGVEGYNVTRTAVGGPIGAFYVRKMLGIFQTQADVTNHTTTVNGVPVVIQPGARPGDVMYADLNGDGLITDADRYNAGSGIPTLEGGLFFDGRFGGFDFSLGLRGSYGNEVLNVARWWTDRLDDPTNYRADIQPWTAANPSLDTPRAIKEGPNAASNARLDSDRFVENGSYLRLQNLQVGYALPAGLTRRWAPAGGESRIYVNFQNLLTITGYNGYDPEATGIVYNDSRDALLRGVDAGQIYPNQRTISIGIDLGF
ncbi:MAG TPA: SusC/RagA family TonB-linked outer membrane protein [Gemmatimonadaceae bacterium]|nr:SusC/RagA family TonB-linked outer membrane protein [Gemmatimonadaceae bacterium]